MSESGKEIVCKIFSLKNQFLNFPMASFIAFLIASSPARHKTKETSREVASLILIGLPFELSEEGRLSA